MGNFTSLDNLPRMAATLVCASPTPLPRCFRSSRNDCAPTVTSKRESRGLERERERTQSYNIGR